MALFAAVAVGGCGLNVQAADLFVVTRTGQGQKLSMLVNDGGTISCNGGKPKNLSDPQLLQARDLSSSLNHDVSTKHHFPAHSGGVFTYTVKVQDGTFTFPDTAARTRKELSQLELFVVQAASDPCGIGS